MAKEYIYPDTLAIGAIKGKDIIAKRIWDSIETSGSNPFHWDAVTTDEAWKQVADAMHWGDFLQDRHKLPGGLIEREMMLANGKLVAVAFIGLKDLDRPKGWRVGAMGGNGFLLTLSNFPNKV